MGLCFAQVSGLGTVLVRKSCAAEVSRDGSADTVVCSFGVKWTPLPLVWICLPVDAEWAKPPCAGVCTGAVLTCHVGTFFVADDVYLACLAFCSNWMLFQSLKYHVLDIVDFHFRLVAVPTEQRGDSESCRTAKDGHT